VFASRGIQFLAIGDAKLVKVWSIDHGSLDEGRITNDLAGFGVQTSVDHNICEVAGC